MSRPEVKTIRIRCGTWDQVEAFYGEKVLAAKGNILVVKMPFRPGIGEVMTVALGLPDGLVFAIDGTVVKMGADDGGRVPVAVRLHGLTAEVRAQLKRLVSQGRGPASLPPVGPARAVGTRPPAPVRSSVGARALIETVPPASDPSLRDVVDDEREIFDGLAGTRDRLSSLPAHEVLGVPENASIEQLRSAYLENAMHIHPDRFRRHRSAALRVLASDIFVLVRRAFERLTTPDAGAIDEGWLYAMPDPADPVPLQAANVAPEREAELEAPTEPTPPVEPAAPVEALPAGASSPYSELSISGGAASSSSPSYEDDVSFTTSVRMRALTAEDLFEEEPTSGSMATPLPPPAEPAPAAPDASPPLAASELEQAGRAALADGRYPVACEAFAAFLRQDPRNRQIRALYHVASGLDLRAKGEGVKARLQFETALAHDKECEEAQRALLYEQPDRARPGIFKRFFDK